jgi:hypothetical protein
MVSGLLGVNSNEKARNKEILVDLEHGWGAVNGIGRLPVDACVRVRSK